MGHAIKGEMWLYPEECLFLMDRCSLSMQYCDVDMSLQHAYCEIIGGWLTLEKYQVIWKYLEYFRKLSVLRFLFLSYPFRRFMRI